MIGLAGQRSIDARASVSGQLWLMGRYVPPVGGIDPGRSATLLAGESAIRLFQINFCFSTSSDLETQGDVGGSTRRPAGDGQPRVRADWHRA